MEQFKSPSPLSLTGNSADNWHSWEQSFRRYIAASGEKDEQVKIDILLHTIGEDALEVYNTLTVRAEGDELTMEDVFQAFKDYCSAQKNVVFERYQYWSHQMTAGTSVNRLITELRQRSKDCEFGISEHDMIRDKLVLSITDSHLKKRLLQERGLTLDRAIEICRESEQEKTEHGVKEVPVDDELKIILPDKSLHHNTSRQLGSQSVPNTHQTEKLVLAAFTPNIQLHRLQLQLPSVTDCVFSERKNVEQLLPERLHIKEEPEMLSEGQEEKQLCVQQETNSAACPVKCEDEEEKPQTSQLHWRQLTEINMKEEPSTCTLDEVMKRESVEINSEGPEAAQNQDPRSLLMKIYAGGKPFKCYICGKPFIRMSTLKEHIRSHTGEKPFKCNICGKCYSRSGFMKIHMIVHSGKKLFKCDVCNKSLAYKSDITRHMKIHTGMNKEKCYVCTKYFTSKGNLKRHMRIHSREKPLNDLNTASFNETQSANRNYHSFTPVTNINNANRNGLSFTPVTNINNANRNGQSFTPVININNASRNSLSFTRIININNANRNSLSFTPVTNINNSNVMTIVTLTPATIISTIM